MLEQARALAAEAGVELDLCEGDMRELTLDEQAALIYCPFGALLHLPTWADRRRGLSSRLSSGASTESRSTTTAANKCSSPAAERERPR